MKYFENIRYPDGCKAFIDVTKAPYFADNTGKTDCTSIIVGILDELMKKTYDATVAAYEKLKKLPVGASLGDSPVTENKVVDTEVVCMYPEDMVQLPTLYFPNGTYLVSDTLTYTLEKFGNMRYSRVVGGFELNRCIRFMGQSKDGTVIKLADNCKGFEYGQERAVISFIQGEISNIAMSNYIENITVDVGSGNAGAVGIKFFSNNTGAVRNVRIKSSDPEHRGFAGLLISHEYTSGGYIRNLEVDGFRHGIKIPTRRLYVVMEDIYLRNQTKDGIRIGDMPCSIRKVNFEGNVPGIFIQGPASQVFISDCEFVCHDEKPVYPAVKVEQGCVYLRNITTRGFKNSLNLYWDEVMLPDGNVPEYCTLKTYSFKEGNPVTLNLDVPELPDVIREPDFDKWCCVNDFGAVGDGKHDDTDAIEAAMNSGKPIIWFDMGKYLLTRPVNIPASVKHIHFMFCDIAADEALRNNKTEGVFRITGESDELLFIEKLFEWESCYGEVRMFEHASKRTVYFRDIHTQSCAMYFNSVVGGTVHMENVACTVGDHVKYRHVPAYFFDHQTVWAHWLNPERSGIEAVNKGGIMWILGFKCEHEGSIETHDGGKSEIIGGLASLGHNKGTPFILNDNSEVSAMFMTNGYKSFTLHPVAVKEKRGDKEFYLYGKDMPLRFHPMYYIVPLYSSRTDGTAADFSKYHRDAVAH